MSRFFHRLFSWQTFRRVLLVLVGLVTLIALLWTEEKLRGKYEWEKYKRELEAKGERFDFASFAPPPIPNESNFFMAPIWSGTLNHSWIDPKTGKVESSQTNETDRLSMDPNGPSEIDFPKGGGGWPKGHVTSLKAWQDYYRRVAAVTNLFPIPAQPGTPAEDVLVALSKFDSKIEKLRLASERPGGRLPLDYKDPPVMINRLLPILADVKGCAPVLVMRAKAELASDKTPDALKDVKLMLRLTDSIRDQPLLISSLVQIAMMTITINPIYEGLAEHRWTEKQLVEIQMELAHEDFLADFETVMRCERAFGIPLQDSLRHERSLDPFYYQRQTERARRFQDSYLPCVNTKTRVVSPGEVGRLLEASERERIWITLYDTLTKKQALDHDKTASVMNKAVTRTARTQVSVDLARVACALERYYLAHDQYPGTLDVLTPQFIDKLPHDIINGQPLHYRRTEDGRFILYSVGWNEKDDGGVRGKSGGWDTETGDWVWEYPAKTYFE